LQFGDVFGARFRGGVAAVQEGVDHDAAVRVFLPRAAHDLEEMLLVGVDAFVLEKSEEVEA
jgi:hypothetical protein